MHPSNPQQPRQQPNIPSEPLRWLFVAHYVDGSTFEQPANDLSRHFDPKADHNPSAYNDAMEQEDKLVGFELRHIDGKQTVYCDLVAGAFVINGTPFHAHDQFFDPSQHKLKLVYHREKVEQGTATATVQDDMSIDVSPVEHTRSYTRRYFIGWQAVGTKHKAIIAVG